MAVVVVRKVDVEREQYLRTEFDAETQIMRIILDRQDNAKNQLDTQVVKYLQELLYPQMLEPTWHGVVLISGKDKVFSAGADIEGELKDLNAEQAARFAAAGREVFSLLSRIPCPTVVAINGFCLGGGLELSLCCDFRIATKRSRLALPEIDLGVLPGWGGTQRLQRLIGMSRAKQMIFSGAPVNGATALEYGLIDELVDDSAELLPAAEKLLGRFSRKSRIALGLAKRAINEGSHMSLDDALKLESDIFGLAWSTPDRVEGINAFLEKRKPVWPE